MSSADTSTPPPPYRNPSHGTSFVTMGVPCLPQCVYERRSLVTPPMYVGMRWSYVDNSATMLSVKNTVSSSPSTYHLQETRTIASGSPAPTLYQIYLSRARSLPQATSPSLARDFAKSRSAVGRLRAQELRTPEGRASLENLYCGPISST